MRSSISFQRPDGKTVQGYLAEPTSATGVVVIQE